MDVCVNAEICMHYICIFIIIIIDLPSDCIRKRSLALRDMMSLVRGMLQDKSPVVPKVVIKVKLRKANLTSITQNAKYAIKCSHGLFYICQ